MTASGLWLAPFAAQAALMIVDEFHYHRRRGLGRWESWGHPLDTASLLACLAWARFAAFSPGTLGVYAGGAVCSCVLITKDEWVHARECEPGEHWVHSMLFVLHPIVLAAAAHLWSSGGTGGLLFSGLVLTIFLYLLYQLFFWNVWRSRAQYPASASSSP